MGDERRPRIAVLRQLPDKGLEGLVPKGEVVLWQGDAPPTREQAHELVRGCDAAVVFDGDLVDAVFLDAAGERLRVVALACADFDTVDQAEARERGVVVTHTSTVPAETTADAVVSLMLMSRRRLGPAIGSLQCGGQQPFRTDGFPGLDLHGTKLGLVGYGPVARAVARRALGFDMTIQHCDPHEPDNIVSRLVGLDELLRTSDIVSLHVPPAPRSASLIGRRELAMMKPTATLVNVSRGDVVDERALAVALRTGTLHSAGLDVVERTPRDDEDDPLLAAPNLVVLPCVGSASEATLAAMVDLAVRNVLAVLNGFSPITPLPGTVVRPS
ncbi:NAD(P)-dependent oxidoreductase [Lentzea sp. JNUCC 0626]|uniref:NAD(P)-dependent oxidoreductase n=1 Tax=Lentzea sp. JNUCC 0626 TaxID=3367513 RepID=UPI0037487110